MDNNNKDNFEVLRSIQKIPIVPKERWQNLLVLVWEN